MISTLYIRLLGDFLLVSGDTPVSSFDMPRLQSLLAYLLLHHPAPQSRSHLAYLLWPDSSDGQAHTNLRNLLYKLRQVLPDADSFLRVERQTLSLQPDALLDWDVMDFERAIVRAEQAKRAQDSTAERQALEEAVRLYRGALLPSCYDEWISSERDRLSQLFLAALERLIMLQEREHDYQAAIRTAQCLLHYDPLHEAAYRHLMRLHARSGNSAAVVRTYKTCAAVLERELGVRPSTVTREAYERLVEEEEVWILPEVSRFIQVSSTTYQREQTSQRTLVAGAGYRSL